MNVRQMWIDCLHEFASPALQQLWVTGHEQIVVSFTECMCGYFDDLNLVDGLDAAVEEGWLSSTEARAVADFHRLADEYDDRGYDDADVLKDPAWLEIVAAAQQAWLQLRMVTTDSAELEQMTDLEKRWGEIGPCTS